MKDRVNPRIRMTRFGLDGWYITQSMYGVLTFYIGGRLVAIGGDYKIRVAFSSVDLENKLRILRPATYSFRQVSRDELERTYQEMIAKGSLAYMDAVLQGKEVYHD